VIIVIINILNMTSLNQVYKCTVCGNIVEVLHGADGELNCCAKAMMLMDENTVDAAVEKHVPVLSEIDGGFKVVVGDVLHPMDDDHYIEWIEIVADGIVYRKDLSAGDAPEAEFMIKASSVVARAYCNLHGLWKS
jgi:superoxide reductase